MPDVAHLLANSLIVVGEGLCLLSGKMHHGIVFGEQ